MKGNKNNKEKFVRVIAFTMAVLMVLPIVLQLMY
ncbi:hypothetical protein J2Z71_000771 [Peptoniphilus stercorisuis]|uniref:DUF4044 domain-containing protein n=1 Tax=Peptoniphilus stercorisuis TaxID=1436965 RepID=A0ABS4KBT9_9FIRM|nr:hypothetical protein [Peptoniphilus stercorisuis]